MEIPMKFICMGCVSPGTFESMSESAFHAGVDACFEYDDMLRSNGHFAAGHGLQPPNTAKTLTWKDGQVLVTDGPFAETKEFIGGLLILEARDLDHAVELISQHPGVKFGPWEIRPAADLNEMIQASEIRRSRRS
jgi:hypothetical protein